MASRFIWYELMTSDLEAAKAFYSKVVGWNTKAWGEAGAPPYVILEAQETGVGGMMPVPEDAQAMGARPAWLGYLHVTDVDKAAESLKAAGGKVHRAPADIPGVGRFAVVADPGKAMFMLLAPLGEDRPLPPPGISGHVGWRELFAENLDEALEFYGGQFGWTRGDAFDMGAMGVYQLFATAEGQQGGMMRRPPQVPAAFWLYYFNVEAIDAAADRVKSAGGSVMMGPAEVPGGMWIVQAMDPQGAMFGLLASKR